MKVLAITQARSGSTRLPNKILKYIDNKTLLEIHLNRIKKSKSVDELYIATTTKDVDDAIVNLANKLSVNYYRGSEEDVLDRFYQTARIVKPDLVVRLTSDCPLIDHELIDELISKAKDKKLDYYSNILEERFPDGQDIEVMSFDALERAWKLSEISSDREHVTSFIRNNSTYNGGSLFESDNHHIFKDYSSVRLTVDEPNDYEVIKLLIAKLGVDKSWVDYAEMYLKNDEINRLNANITRNEGYFKSLKND